VIVHRKSFEIALQAAKANNIPLSHVFTIDDYLEDYSGVNDIIKEGRDLPPIERIVFKKGESRRRLAFLSFSSGTSGLPKAVMISHGNIISNLCQSYEFDKGNLQDGIKRVACGVLPFYHGKSLISAFD
jgi:acyl-CoA synthetase (AMP-forming)/AMP-acid ligase II